MTKQVEIFALKLAEIEKLKSDLEMLKQSMYITPAASREVTRQDLAIIEDALAFMPDAPAGVSNLAPPPPPPPLPTEGAMPLKYKARAKAKPAPLTREQLENRVAEAISASDISKANFSTATKNFLAAFSGPRANRLLEALVTDYGFLISRLPLQPKTCYLRMQLWEKHLFSKLEPDEAASYRKRKVVEIGKLSDESDILAEISNIFKAIDIRRKEAQQQAEIQETKGKAGSLLAELKQRQDADAAMQQAALAKDELLQMECGQICLDDDDGIVDERDTAADTEAKLVAGDR
jgi:hypothetical protein